MDVGDEGGDRREALSASGNTELGRLCRSAVYPGLDVRAIPRTCER